MLGVCVSSSPQWIEVHESDCVPSTKTHTHCLWSIYFFGPTSVEAHSRHWLAPMPRAGRLAFRHAISKTNCFQKHCRPFDVLLPDSRRAKSHVRSSTKLWRAGPWHLARGWVYARLYTQYSGIRKQWATIMSPFSHNGTFHALAESRLRF